MIENKDKNGDSPKADTVLQLPLCVDLDGTLILTDSLWEACLRLIASKPQFILYLPFWLLKGKAGFKQMVSQHIDISADGLPFNKPLLKYLRSQKDNGRILVLVTAANAKIAHAVADHVGVFDSVIASNATQNLSGERKAAALVGRYGEKAYVYAANAYVDVPVWRHAAAAVVVSHSQQLKNKVREITDIEKYFDQPKPLQMRTLAKAMRLHQWAKNILVFAALVLSHTWDQSDKIYSIFWAFIAFNLAASSIYLINDLIDLDADRKHHEKQSRPLASGHLSIQYAIPAAIVLMLVSLVIALNINVEFFAMIVFYLILTTVYTFYLKHKAILDVMILASLYTLRIIAGAVAISVPVSNWLLAFSIFFFFSLALIKRYSELRYLHQQGELNKKARGYLVGDIETVSHFGISSGYISVLVLVLYINDLQASALYSQSEWLWLVCLVLLFWISRFWLLTHRGILVGDPVLFALRDKNSYFVSLCVLVSLLLAL